LGFLLETIQCWAFGNMFLSGMLYLIPPNAPTSPFFTIFFMNFEVPSPYTSSVCGAFPVVGLDH